MLPDHVEVMSESEDCRDKHRMPQHSTEWHKTAQRSAAQHSTAQHSAAQRSTAQHSSLLHTQKLHCSKRRGEYVRAGHREVGASPTRAQALVEGP